MSALHRFKLADVREFLPGGVLHKYLATGPLAGAQAEDINALFCALAASPSEGLPVESGPADDHSAVVFGRLRRVELRGPELWGEASFIDDEVPLCVAAFGLTIAFFVGWGESLPLQAEPRLLYAFPASGPRDPELYPGAYEPGGGP